MHEMPSDRAASSKSESSPNKAKLQIDDEIRGKILADGFEAYLNDAEMMGLLYFLYLRKFFEHDEHRRKRDIGRILSSKPTTASVPTIRGPYQRLQTIVRKESDNSVPPLQFIAFCASMAAIVATEYAADESATTISPLRWFNATLCKKERQSGMAHDESRQVCASQFYFETTFGIRH